MSRLEVLDYWARYITDTELIHFIQVAGIERVRKLMAASEPPFITFGDWAKDDPSDDELAEIEE